MMPRIASLDRDGIKFNLGVGKTRSSVNRFSVVIGPNASGKSRLLRVVVEEAIERIRQPRVAALSPTKPCVLAISSLVTDAFPFAFHGDSDYRYLGVRQNRNFVTTGSVRDLTANSIALALRDGWRLNAVLHAVTLLDFADISVVFRGGSRRRRDQLQEFIKALGHDHDLSGMTQSDGGQILAALRGIGDGKNTDTYSSISLAVEKVKELINLAEKWKIDPHNLLLAAKRAGVMEVHLAFHDRSGWVDEDRLSTGQFLFLSLIARVVAYIEPGSVVAIDEPETALHPSWQANFIPLLRSAIPDHFESHIFLATHSPHIVADGSDLLVPGERWGHFVEYADPFFGRTPEELLYRAFGARITGNSVVDEDLTIIAEAIAGARTEAIDDEVRAAMGRLQAIAGTDTPVVNEFLRAARRLGEEAR